MHMLWLGYYCVLTQRNRQEKQRFVTPDSCKEAQGSASPSPSWLMPREAAQLAQLAAAMPGYCCKCYSFNNISFFISYGFHWALGGLKKACLMEKGGLLQKY